ncbi:hypothetical protein [Salinarimonas ramus]|uniref:Uncharacterized protein n=1 Tax=Salinarimonas ramus TaxID=690164 RepID=A0A917QE11_9HYPH|nr:hypothetical protein [Salinarimonas ramus]GGK46250.1 hypothetical protein GCM10011322_36640 [Salinarimonas ramus]
MRRPAAALAVPAPVAVRWRGIGLPAACLALALAATLLALAIWSRTLLSRETAQIDPLVTIALAGREVTLAESWLIGTPEQERAERIALEAPLGALADVNGPVAGAMIGVTLVPADDAPPPAVRPAQLYNRFLEPSAATTPDGLIVRRFAPGTPYEGETLHLAPPQGRVFAARCLEGEAAAGVRLPCLAEIRRGGLDAQVRLPREALREWSRIVAAVERLAGSPTP